MQVWTEDVMGRTAGSTGLKTSAKIKETAITLIARHGFEAMSMRDLGAAVGVGAPALYRYYPTKQVLLYSLLCTHLDDLAAARAATDNATSSCVTRLNAFVANHIAFHVERRMLTQISNFELRSLDKENLTLILRKRNDYEKELRTILRAGHEAGDFKIADVTLTAMAIIQMITGVVVWFRPDEKMPVSGVIENYQILVARLVGQKGA
jgi:AcrR family transcriptional regulator